MTVTTISGLVLVIIAVCQAIKYAGLSTRFIPVLAILLGVAGSFYFSGADWFEAASGVIAGLTASGLWSGVRATAQI